MINADAIRKNSVAVTSYVRDAFEVESGKRTNQCKYIIVPYNEGYVRLFYYSINQRFFLVIISFTIHII